MNKTLSKALTCTFAFSLLATSFQFPLQAKAANAKIVGMTAKGLSTSGHDAAKAIDGDKTTYWQTPTPYESINSYQRNIDLDLNGLYALSGINLFTQANEYYQYSIYVSEDGYAFNKVAYKSDDTLSNATGDSHTLNNVPARYVRININYKSGAARQVDLNEVEIFGSKTSDTKAPVKEIKTDDFKDSSWGKEFEKVNTNSAYAKQKTIKEASDLVARVIGEQYRDKFVFDIREQADDENDLFTIDNAGTGKIKITGNDGVSLASGFNYYIKNYCNVDYNPLFSSNLKMPVILPSLKTKIAKETQYDLRYALNFCTYSYTMAFWNWDEYEEFIDWAAMNGINLMLDVIGQEEVQRRMLREYGYTDQEIKDYITGPGYFAWFYMQNMGGYGGPLPDNWFENRIELGRKVHDRMQAYGIKPVLEGFA
ncbi:MAG: alpha-N-acetylglucosaminidase TIM-barrel domain-containing protein, partial [Anaerorhabdus sp.]